MKRSISRQRKPKLTTQIVISKVRARANSHDSPKFQTVYKNNNNLLRSNKSLAQKQTCNCTSGRHERQQRLAYVNILKSGAKRCCFFFLLLLCGCVGVCVYMWESVCVKGVRGLLLIVCVSKHACRCSALYGTWQYANVHKHMDEKK